MGDMSKAPSGLATYRSQRSPTDRLGPLPEAGQGLDVLSHYVWARLIVRSIGINLALTTSVALYRSLGRMVRVHVLYQGITQDCNSNDETLKHVSDLLEAFEAPSIARVYNISGCYFVEPNDVLSDVVRQDDQLWITTVERWRECRSLGLVRNESGVVDMDEVECSHTRADARRCSMCAMIRSMLAFEVATEREVHRRSISVAGSPVVDQGVGGEGEPPSASDLRGEGHGEKGGQALGQNEEERGDEELAAYEEGGEGHAAVVHDGLEDNGQGGGGEEPLPPPPQPEPRFARYEAPKPRPPGQQAGKGKGRGKAASQPPMPPSRLAPRAQGSSGPPRIGPTAPSPPRPQPAPKVVSPPRAPVPHAPKPSRSLSPSSIVRHRAPPPTDTRRRIEPPTRRAPAPKKKPSPPPPPQAWSIMPQPPLPSFSSPLRRASTPSTFPRQKPVAAAPLLPKPTSASPSPRPPFRISVNTGPHPPRPRPSPHRSKAPLRPTPLHPAASPRSPPTPCPQPPPPDSSSVAPLLHQWVTSQLEGSDTPVPSPGPQRHVSPSQRYPFLDPDAGPTAKARMAQQLGSFVEEYALSFATHFAPTLHRLRGRYDYRLSEIDLLLWALFQHAARRGAVANHLQHVNTDMSLPQLRSLCYELLLLQGSIKASEDQTSAAGLPPRLLSDLFTQAHRFADLIDVAAEAPDAGTQQGEAEGVGVLRAFYAASTGASSSSPAATGTGTGGGDRQHASINFTEFVYLCLHLATAVQKRVARRERRRGRLDNDSPMRGGHRRARSPMMWSPPCSPKARRTAGGGLTDVILNMQRHTAHRTSAALRHLLVYHLIPFASNQGQLRLHRQTRLGLLHPPPLLSPHPPTPAGHGLWPPAASPAWALDCNRTQLFAIFQHYCETSAHPSPRHLSTGMGPAGGSSNNARQPSPLPLARSSHVGGEALRALAMQLHSQRGEGSACASSSGLCPSNQSIGRRLSLSRLTDRTRRESLAPPPAVSVECGNGPAALREKRLSLEQLHRFASQFLLLPHIVSLEELATAFRVAQEGEYRAWCARRGQRGQGAHQSQRDGQGPLSGVADMVTRLKHGEDVAVPASPHVLSLSFDGFLHVLNGIALAGYGADAVHLLQRPMDYLLEHLDSSKGKRHLRQLYQYKVTKPFVLTRGAAAPAATAVFTLSSSPRMLVEKRDAKVEPAGHLVTEDGLSFPEI